MSTKILRYLTLYDHLKESIEFEKAQSVELSTGKRVQVNIEGKEVGIKVEGILPRHLSQLFKKGSNLYNDYEMKGSYFNVGFDVEGVTKQVDKTNYKTLAKILGVVVKSLSEWLKEVQPEVVTIFADGDTSREKRKKLIIYTSILQGNPQIIKGYTWEQMKTPEGEPMVVLVKFR